MLVAGERLAPQCLVYGLVDPREPERIRYVGKTTQAPLVRYVQHLKSTGTGNGWLRRSWLSLLKKARRQPTMVLLERVAAEELDACERRWIRELQAIGQADTNAPAPRDDRADARAKRADWMARVIAAVPA